MTWGRSIQSMENHMLLCVTEVASQPEIDALVVALGEAAQEVGQ